MTSPTAGQSPTKSPGERARVLCHIGADGTSVSTPLKYLPNLQGVTTALQKVVTSVEDAMVLCGLGELYWITKFLKEKEEIKRLPKNLFQNEQV